MPLTTQPAATWTNASWIAGALQQFRNPQPLNALLVYIRGEMGFPQQYLFTPATEFCPAWFAVRWETNNLLLIEGTTSLRQAQRVCDEYVGIIQQGFNDPTNEYLIRAARSITTAIKAAHFYGPREWIVGGHSLGGAIAQCLDYIDDRILEDRPRVQIVTFGSPRVTNRTQARNYDAVTSIFRFMMPNDPIPLIPPRTSEFLPLPTVLGVRQALRCGNFVHPGNGIQLDADGTVSYPEVPSLATVGMVVSMANWMYSFIDGSQTEHNLQAYIGRLDALAASTRIRPVPQEGPREQPEGMSRTHTVQRERQGQAIVVAIERQQNSVPVVVPENDKFKHQKIGKLHFVTFRGEVLASGTRKRKMIAVKNDLNDALRRLQTVALVDTESLKNALATYLDEAADPAGTFSPIMRTSWNEGFRE